jgi:hypothetical protein
MTLATGARAIMAWALRSTKQLSPVKTSLGPAKQFAFHKFKDKPFAGAFAKTGKGFQPHKQYRPWAKWAAGSEKTGLGWLKIGPEGRTKALYAYGKGYKHVRKHKKLYVGGVAGAAAWDFLPGKDNPKA